MLRDGELKSSRAQFRAESPKSGNLPTIPKRSLNADVEAWVANGGVVTVVAMAVRKDMPVALNSNWRKIRKKDK